MEILQDILKLLSDGGALAIWGLGVFLGYKLAFTTIISLSIVNVFKKIIEYMHVRSNNDQKLVQLAAKAGMTWPLSMDEWLELNKRVEKKDK